MPDKLGPAENCGLITVSCVCTHDPSYLNRSILKPYKSIFLMDSELRKNAFILELIGGCAYAVFNIRGFIFARFRSAKLRLATFCKICGNIVCRVLAARLELSDSVN